MYEACMDEQGDLSHEPSSKCSSWRWNTGESPSNELKNYGMFKMLWCSSQKNSACWIVHSNQVCGVFYIKRYHTVGEEADTTSFKCMVRYARTGPALSTQHGLDIGWSTTCDREYTIVVHINVEMFRGSFQCETPSRHDVCLHDKYFTSNRPFNDSRRLFTRIKQI